MHDFRHPDTIHKKLLERGKEMNSYETEISAHTANASNS